MVLQSFLDNDGLVTDATLTYSLVFLQQGNELIGIESPCAFLPFSSTSSLALGVSIFVPRDLKSIIPERKSTRTLARNLSNTAHFIQVEETSADTQRSLTNENHATW